MDVQRKDMIIAVGVTIGAAVLVLFMRNRNSASTGGAQNGGVSDIAGGFQTASTVFVPTSAYDLQYNTYKGSVTYSTVTNNNQSQTTTTYAPVDSNNNSPTGSNNSAPTTSIVVPLHQGDTFTAPVIVTGSNDVINPPTSQTNTAPVAPPPVAPPPPPPHPAWEGALMPGYHYATPNGGFNTNTSVVDNLKANGFNAGFDARTNLAGAMGIQGYTGTAAQNIQMLHTLQAAGL